MGIHIYRIYIIGYVVDEFDPGGLEVLKVELGVMVKVEHAIELILVVGVKVGLADILKGKL